MGDANTQPGKNAKSASATMEIARSTRFTLVACAQLPFWSTSWLRASGIVTRAPSQLPRRGLNCWLRVTEMDGLDVGAVLHCQRLETLACAGTVFASTIWNGLLAVNGFQNIFMWILLTKDVLCGKGGLLWWAAVAALYWWPSAAVLVYLRTTSYFWAVVLLWRWLICTPRERIAAVLNWI